ncbi:helix-turn-helix domain-containing protein [Streptomyces sp. NPDC002067]
MATASQRDVDAEDHDPRRLFGDALREARELYEPKPMTQAELALRLSTSPASVSRLEGNGTIPADVPAKLDEIFSTDGLFKRLYADIMKSAFSDYAKRRIELEERAVEIADWTPTVVPGLLQTENYARTLLRAGNPRATDAELSKWVKNRIARQAILSRSGCPDLTVVLCESVIRRRVGTPEVMRSQLAYLLSHASRPTTRLQVLPLHAEPHGLMDGPLTTLTLPDGAVLAYTEGIATGAVIEDPAKVRHLRRAYDGVSASALSGMESASLIRRCMEEL